MQIEVKIDSKCHEPRVIVFADKMTDEVSEIVRRLSEDTMGCVAGFSAERAVLLDQNDIIRIYAADGKVYAVTADGEYRLRMRLYELEARLDEKCFVRISNSEIVNLKKTREFDLSLTGTIRVALSDGTFSYVSRRYVSKIKQVLGV